MNSNTSKLIRCCALVVGVGLWGGMAKKFASDGKLSYRPNVACIKGSPYGKVAALAMQGPIGFYWHKGTMHEDAQVLGGPHHDHTEGCADQGCGHDHGQDVKHACTEAHAGKTTGETYADGCSCGAHDEQAAQEIAKDDHDESLRLLAKHQIKKMAAAARRKTDGKPLTPAHEKYLQSVMEDKLRLAYELDPSNYTNYANYHLFVAASNFGKTAADDDAAVALARRTLRFCKKDQVDPASWVTAASAAYNIIFHIGKYHKQFTVPEAKASLAEFDFCIKNYTRLRGEALESGNLISEVRTKEMEERVRYLMKLRKAQGVYMKRVMSQNMTGNMTGNNNTSKSIH